MSERVLPLLLDARRARKQGSKAIAQRQRARLAEVVAYARAHSAYLLASERLTRIDERLARRERLRAQQSSAGLRDSLD